MLFFYGGHMSLSFRSQFSAALAATSAIAVGATLVLAPVDAAHAQHSQQPHAATPPVAPAPIASPLVSPVAATSARRLRSIMDGYQRFDTDTAPADWRKANDTVREIGGWHAYARQSAAQIAQERARSGADMASPAGAQK
jgi:hypothetical protein